MTPWRSIGHKLSICHATKTTVGQYKTQGSVHLSNLKLAVTNVGFKSVKSTVEQSFCLPQISEKSIEYGIDTQPLFIDSKDVPALREAFSSLEISADRMGLTVNDTKTKYMPVLETPSSDTLNNLKICLQEFETAPNFNYLVKAKSIITEIQNRISLAN
ncbi:hypothetical protein CEXT_240341 [Caerostris extrusa]|uniref:Reverse transcriptase domain-containing protein n=1 Tax=Caerostris extrusa TaxID=172846 RepID=A0AAV4XL02_CAEEX|nr:hypothetical protein CEXT_240341 [Caerostris extrusa]